MACRPSTISALFARFLHDRVEVDIDLSSVERSKLDLSQEIAQDCYAVNEKHSSNADTAARPRDMKDLILGRVLPLSPMAAPYIQPSSLRQLEIHEHLGQHETRTTVAFPRRNLGDCITIQPELLIPGCELYAHG